MRRIVGSFIVLMMLFAWYGCIFVPPHHHDRYDRDYDRYDRDRYRDHDRDRDRDRDRWDDRDRDRGDRKD